MSGLLSLYVAVAAPLLIAVFLLGTATRRFVAFFLVGLTVCLLAAYINTFLTTSTGLDAVEAMVKLTPISEEVLKALPLFFYVAVFRPKRTSIAYSALAIGLGFAMMENAYALMEAGGSGGLSWAVARGFAAGVMHATCSAGLGYGLAFVHGRRYLVGPVAFGLLCITSTGHAIYNLFVSAGGAWQVAGYLLPFAVVVLLLAVVRLPRLTFTD